MLEPNLKLRIAKTVGIVQNSQAVTLHMQRITLAGAEIVDFLAVDGIDEAAAWVKVFLPSGEGRAYTIQSVDRQAGTLVLDFVLHGTNADAGPK